MSYALTQEDLMLVLQQSSAPQTCRLKVEVLDKNETYVGEIDGIVSGSCSIDAESDVRRTAQLTVSPTYVQNIKLSEDNLVWLDKDIRIFVGLYNVREKDYKYYPLGYYVYTDTSIQYDTTTNQLSVNCSDFMTKLDGTKNGQQGSLKTIFPAYEKNSSGEVAKYNLIRDAVVSTLEDLCGITNHRIDDIGEFYAMPENNSDWETYRANNPLWNTLPFDQEFEVGCTALSILTTFRDLYPNYEIFFDMDNTFVCQMIPSCNDDDYYLENDYLQRVLVSEDSTLELSSIRNICEVWGQVLEPDFYCETVTYENGVYSATIENYTEEYKNRDVIALKMPNENTISSTININNYGEIPVLNDDDSAVETGKLKKNEVYCFKISKIYKNGSYTTKAHLLGQWQAHAINVLTDGTISTETKTDQDGVAHQLYSKSYFQAFYNCENVTFEVVPDSHFTVQKLVEILDVKTGDEYENITSDTLAADRARWENWKNCRLTDNVTITTALLPWLDVNKKVSYKPRNCDEVLDYIIKSISHDFEKYTTSITMMRFYPLYIEEES